MILADLEISRLVEFHQLLTPFNEKNLNSYGYDLTLADEFKVPELNTEQQVVDPFNPPPFAEILCKEYIIIPSRHFVLGRSVEQVKMPRDVTGICLGRSTYARAGVLVHVTPLEAGWEGTVTIEISNTNPLPVKVWVDRGITQVIFLKGRYPPKRSYVEKGGRYQGQTGVTQGKA